MSEMKEMLVEVVDRLLKKFVLKETVDLLEGGEWAEEVWNKLLKQELEKTAWQQTGGDCEDLLALYERIGYYGAPIPFVAQTLANSVVEHANLAPFEEPVTFAFHTGLSFENKQALGTIPFVQWGRWAKHFVIIEPTQLIVASREQVNVLPSTNLAAEPRDSVVFQATPVHCYPITTAQFAYYEALHVASYVALMTGAVSRAVALSIQFSKERQQFGQPIHRFQLVQQHLASLAGERAIATAALENVMVSMQQGRFDDIFLARVRLEDTARLVAASAHQIHAAIGVTFEHSLHQMTRRLWAWRDEGKSAQSIREQLVEHFLQTEQDVWAYLTKGDR